MWLVSGPDPEHSISVPLRSCPSNIFRAGNVRDEFNCKPLLISVAKNEPLLNDLPTASVRTKVMGSLLLKYLDVHTTCASLLAHVKVTLSLVQATCCPSAVSTFEVNCDQPALWYTRKRSMTYACVSFQNTTAKLPPHSCSVTMVAN